MIQTKLSKYEFNIEYNVEYGDKTIVDRFNNKCPYFSDKMKLSGDVCIDIGAHIGLFSLIASQHFKKVFSFEPLMENLFLFNQNIVLNDAFNIEATNQAVGKDYGTRIIKFYSENLHGASFYSSRKYRDSDNHGVEVERMVYLTNIKSIKKQLKIGKIDFLKISANYSEYEILESLEKLDFDNIKNIGIEYFLKRHDSYNKLIDILKENKYNIEIDKLEKSGFIRAFH